MIISLRSLNDTKKTFFLAENQVGTALARMDTSCE